MADLHSILNNYIRDIRDTPRTRGDVLQENKFTDMLSGIKTGISNSYDELLKNDKISRALNRHNLERENLIRKMGFEGKPGYTNEEFANILNSARKNGAVLSSNLDDTKDAVRTLGKDAAIVGGGLGTIGAGAYGADKYLDHRAAAEEEENNRAAAAAAAAAEEERLANRSPYEVARDYAADKYDAARDYAADKYDAARDYAAERMADLEQYDAENPNAKYYAMGAIPAALAAGAGALALRRKLSKNK